MEAAVPGDLRSISGPGYTEEQVRAIARHHGLPQDVSAMPRLGIVNDIWSLGGQYVLRIPLKEEWVEDILVEEATIPIAAACGVRMPRRVVFDDSRSIVPVAFAIQEMVRGETLGTLPIERVRRAELFREIGREIAKLHLNAPPSLPGVPGIKTWMQADARETLGPAIERNLLSPAEIERVERWIGMLEAAGGDPLRTVFTHCDLHAWNIMVRPVGGVGEETYELAAFIDWGDACYSDPVVDFSGMPLWAIPWMLEGYREAGGTTDEGFEARTLLHWIRVALWELKDLAEVDFARDWWRWPEGGLDTSGDLIGCEKIRSLLP